MRMRDRSNQGFPCPWAKLEEGFQHILSLWAPPSPSTGTMGGLLKCLQRGCELGPRAPGPESSPPWPPCPALQKGGSLCPQQELLALQRDSEEVR